MAESDLELGLRWLPESERMDVSLRYTPSDAMIDVWGPRTELAIDLPELARKRGDVDGYAAKLTDMVFENSTIANFCEKALAQVGDSPLHFRLNLDAPQSFHDVRWELLREPVSRKYPIATTEHVLFSRYLTNPDFRSLPSRAMRPTKALVAIAAPTDIGGYELSVDINDERFRAETACNGMDTVFLTGTGEATLQRISEELEHGADILYLVCHGLLTDDVPIVLLEDEAGKTVEIDGRRLAEMVYNLRRRPVLAVLCSCQSAGRGTTSTSLDEGALSALGPRLAGAGIAAVVAMQGNVLVSTAQAFVGRFFEELRSDGVVDRAVSAARREIYLDDRRDWWAPTLFSRLRSGRTYFRPQFTERGAATWDSLVRSHEEFVPVIGPGLADRILGSRQLIAEQWATDLHMPISAHCRTDLARVAQFLRVDQKSSAGVVNRLEKYLEHRLRSRIKDARSGDPLQGLQIASDNLEEMLLTIGAKLREQEDDPYRIAAAMDVPIFVTTGWTTLLEEALEARGKHPRSAYFPWREAVRWPRADLKAKPTAPAPLVYHLFGSITDLNSLVLTEDDYFDWLTQWIECRRKVPQDVTSILVNRPLLFLGYQLDEWDFRVVFQAIKSIPAAARLFHQNQHIGVQFSPQSQLVEPEAAQDYLESFFGEDRVNIFWADTTTFLDEYRQRTGMRT